MEAFLESNGLDRLSAQLSEQLTLQDALSLLKEGRPKLMERIAELGVVKPPDKQAFCKAVANAQRDATGSGLPVLVCAYSAGVSSTLGRKLMAPLLEACHAIGLTDQVVIDHHNMPPYDSCKTFSEYISMLHQNIIAASPERAKRPWIIIAHSHGAVAAYGLARFLGLKMRVLVVLCRRPPTIELLEDVFGVPTCEEIELMPIRSFAQTLGTVYTNKMLVAMTNAKDENSWSASTRESVEIARAQYMSHVGLCSAVDIRKEIGERNALPCSAKLQCPTLVVTTPQETTNGETAEKASGWKELTSGTCAFAQVDAPHMEVPTRPETIKLVVQAVKIHVLP